MNKNEIPKILIALANSRKPRKPSGYRVKLVNDQLADSISAISFLTDLENLGDYAMGAFHEPIDDDVLTELHHLREAIEKIIEVLANTNQMNDHSSDLCLPAQSLSFLNRLSSTCQWTKTIGPNLEMTEIAIDRNLVGLLASKCIRELASFDPSRIKRCERPECGHFFYDTTRNRNAKWHAEDPCGWRSRSDRR